ncbi:glycine cleavage system aminomethyltransferase GcvT [Anaerobranca gottschalkii]|uniref:Aminomethyltransferase n=1 Tax=Anaerobranca gottschalkii DSM 13577 TaxID=1120990 RepID=A0A1H9Y470_9FIRM|nr:glycine cleavage system aminomethyltransferase GcvT [Anaerobranca gottschalkii]SES63138.1 aminomethyltransferase [Anaerobranca gottschalkii DSM 13577]
MDNLKKTPLYPLHLKLQGKMVDFGGWALPVQYTGIIEEVKGVRTKAGLFDVSHMGEIMVTGRNSLDFLQKMVTNNVERLKDHQVQYTLMCYENGGIVDDLLVYKLAVDKYLLVVNAANVEKDYNWLMEHKIEGVEIENISSEVAQIAFQGPKAQQILQKLTNYDLNNLQFFYCAEDVEVAGSKVLISRTGYTGEDGFEIYLSGEDAIKVWEKILEVGEGEVVPAGLGARDTLRFEACLPLYGHEIDKDITPIEANLQRFVKFKKPDYIGKEILQDQLENGAPRETIGFKMIDRGIPRGEFPVFNLEGEKIGHVTTGSYSPTLDLNIGLALVKNLNFKTGDHILIGVRNRQLKAEVINIPFYKREDV